MNSFQYAFTIAYCEFIHAIERCYSWNAGVLIFYLTNSHAISTKLCSVCQKWIANIAWAKIATDQPLHLYAKALKSWKSCYIVGWLWIYVYEHNDNDNIYYLIWSENLLSFECCCFIVMFLQFSSVRLSSCLWAVVVVLFTISHKILMKMPLFIEFIHAHSINGVHRKEPIRWWNLCDSIWFILE